MDLVTVEFVYKCTFMFCIGNTKGLNLAAVVCTTVQVSKTAMVAKATSN
jgi:hypothetical protein